MIIGSAKETVKSLPCQRLLLPFRSSAFLLDFSTIMHKEQLMWKISLWYHSFAIVSLLSSWKESNSRSKLLGDIRKWRSLTRIYCRSLHEKKQIAFCFKLYCIPAQFIVLWWSILGERCNSLEWRLLPWAYCELLMYVLADEI